ncbi:MAG: CTP synthase, partial [Nanoarchaeota archaeon]|nr:CTP synthase [Nanoarchaeota archaeon]
YVLVTYLPIPSHMGEMKTKPTQQAIRMLSESGIFPDFIVCRSVTALDSVRKKKIETYANIQSEHVISEPDIDTIYRIPLDLAAEKLPEKILAEFKLEPRQTPDLSAWAELVERVAHPKKTVNVAMVGKYVATGDFNLSDSYISVNESLLHAGAALNCKVHIDWIDAKKLEDKANVVKLLKDYQGILVPGGFGASGVEGKINAIQYAREHNVPYLGLCYGMQLAVIEFARHVCGMDGANTTENEKETPYPVIDMLESQREILKHSDFGGTMRLGGYVAQLKKGTLVFDLYKERMEEDAPKIAALEKDASQKFRIGKTPTSDAVIERHRHRYEVNPKYIEQIEKKGMVFSGYHTKIDDTQLMEFIELPGHPYFTGTQAHPEFKSGLGRPAPLFYGFVKACCGLK